MVEGIKFETSGPFQNDNAIGPFPRTIISVNKNKNT